MSESAAGEGNFRCGIPYSRFGGGPSIFVIFQGLSFENKPISGLSAKQFFDNGWLEDAYTTYVVTRKPGLPEGHSLSDMADDYAQMIKEEFGAPVDVLGVSTGGSIAQHFAADHPGLLRKLVLHSSAYTLSDSANKAQMRAAWFARRGKWRAAYAQMLSITSHKSFKKLLYKPCIFFMSFFGKSLYGRPDDPSDLAVTIEAEDKLDFKDRLSEITAPTLVIAGDKDPFYTPMLLRDTAKGIPNARLILYKGMGHPALGKQFKKDLKDFLEDTGV